MGEQQGPALRRHAGNEIDWANVAEEIQSVSRSNERKIGSCPHRDDAQLQARCDPYCPDLVGTARELMIGS